MSLSIGTPSGFGNNRDYWNIARAWCDTNQLVWTCLESSMYSANGESTNTNKDSVAVGLVKS